MYRTGHNCLFCVPYSTEINRPFINFDKYFRLRLEIISPPISITPYVSSRRAYSEALRAGMVLTTPKMYADGRIERLSCEFKETH